jgi:predicted nucleic acid-binding protein
MGKLERGDESTETTDLVFAEVVWVLSAQRPKPSRSSIREALSDIVRMPGLAVRDESLLLSALELYESTRIDYIDAYNAVVMRKRGLNRIYSYDTDFDGVPGISRIKP